jgi:hypothetical protein
MLGPSNRPLPTKIKILEHESRRRNHILLWVMGITILGIIGFTCFALFVGFNNVQLKVSKDPPTRNPTLSEARPHTNCSDFEGAIRSVQQIAEGEGYLHVFEYERLHPCCLLNPRRNMPFPYSNAVDNPDPDPPMITTDDIVFIVMTSAQTRTKATAVIESWGKGIQNLLLISDLADPELGSISFNEVSGGVGAASGRPIPTRIDKQHRQIWGMKYIDSDARFAHLKDKKWFFLADDDTWVNIPALLDLTNRYHHQCPVTFGYVWSHVWIEDFDYISGGAGLLLSQKAFRDLTPSFYTDICPFAHYNDITFARCAWTLKVQMVHHRGFYFDPPERSKDRHEVVWFPPIAEAITYHYVHPEEMYVMTNYANERWQWQPTTRNSSNLQEFNNQETTTTTEKGGELKGEGLQSVKSSSDHFLDSHYVPLKMDFIEKVKAEYESKKTKQPNKSPSLLNTGGWFWS